MNWNIKPSLGLWMLLTFWAVMPNASAKTNHEKVRTITKEFDVNDQSIIDITHDRGPAVIEYYDGAKAKLEVIVTVRGENEEDLETILSKYSLDINTSSNFIKIVSSANITGWSMRSVISKKQYNIKFRDGSRIKTRVDRIKAALKLWVPKVEEVKIKNKHDDIRTNDLPFSLHVELFDGSLNAGTIQGEFELTLKHGDGETGKVGHATLDLFDSRVEMKDAQKVQVKSKHSRLRMENIESLDVSSVDSEIRLLSVQSEVDIKDKHSTFRAQEIGSGNWNLFDTKVTLEKADDLLIESKHSEFRINQIQQLELDIFDSDFDIQTLGAIKATRSKHSNFSIDQVNQSLDFREAFDVRLRASSVAPSFSGLDYTGKHGTIELPLNESNIPHLLDIDVKHGRVDYQESAYEVAKHVEKGAELVLRARMKSTDDNGPKVKIRGEDLKLELD
ncbi:MAG: hypothetical protein AAFP19_15690 [Bacteroidota bacterium]